MNLIFKQSINSSFDIALFLQSKGYRQNHDYIALTSFAGNDVYALFVPQSDSDRFKSYTILTYQAILYIFEMTSKRDIKSEFEDEIKTVDF
ncbi:hypothetical protein ACN68I_07180 [Aerococcus viridans]|uniref:hypothetical protein n=1 Tax=Aerococcus viridans TaxID=1377 RepID=UPI003B22742B